jgi:hypothetical protein
VPGSTTSPHIDEVIEQDALTAGIGTVRIGVCTENLNPDVMVMKSAEDRMRLDIPDPLNGTKGRRIFVQ